MCSGVLCGGGGEGPRGGRWVVAPKEGGGARAWGAGVGGGGVGGGLGGGGGGGGSWERYASISRPSVSELYEEASMMSDEMAVPGGMDVGG